MEWVYLDENEKDLFDWEEEQEKIYNEIQKEQDDYKRDLMIELGLLK